MAETNNNKRVTFRLKSEKKKGLALLIYDLKQPKLIPVKLLTFIILSGKFYSFTQQKKTIFSSLSLFCGASEALD